MEQLVFARNEVLRLNVNQGPPGRLPAQGRWEFVRGRRSASAEEGCVGSRPKEDRDVRHDGWGARGTSTVTGSCSAELVRRRLLLKLGASGEPVRSAIWASLSSCKRAVRFLRATR